MRKAIIIGASSGIGRALAIQLSREGYDVGIAARREKLLQELQAEIGGNTTWRFIDLADHQKSMETLREWIKEMGHVDLVVIASTYSKDHLQLEWDIVHQTIIENVLGSTALINVAMEHFFEQGSGHLVVFSSLAAIRGMDERAAYGASKAFLEKYVGAIRMKLAKMKSPIKTLVVQPGSVDTEQLAGMENLFWVVPVEKAAAQISVAIRRGATHIYVSRRWRLIAWVMKALPNFIFDRLPQARQPDSVEPSKLLGDE